MNSQFKLEIMQRGKINYIHILLEIKKTVYSKFIKFLETFQVDGESFNTISEKWRYIMESRGFRCDDGAYLDITKNPEEWLNFDVFLDHRQANLIEIIPEGINLAGNLHRFKEWWEKRANKEIENFINVKDSYQYFQESSDSFLGFTKPKDSDLSLLKFQYDENSKTIKGEENIILPSMDFNDVFKNEFQKHHIVLGNNIYSLELEEKGNLVTLIEKSQSKIKEKYDATVEELQKVVSKTLEKIKNNYSEKLKELETSAPFPLWWDETIKGNIFSKQVDNNWVIRMIFPILFAPKYAQKNDGLFNLNQETQNKLKHKVRLVVDIYYDSTEHCYRLRDEVQLMHARKNTKFHHYHSNEGSRSDCMGTFRFTREEIRNQGDVKTLIKTLEKFYETINLDDLANSNPPGLLHISELGPLGQSIENVGSTWDTLEANVKESNIEIPSGSEPITPGPETSANLSPQIWTSTTTSGRD